MNFKKLVISIISIMCAALLLFACGGRSSGNDGDDVGNKPPISGDGNDGNSGGGSIEAPSDLVSLAEGVVKATAAAESEIPSDATQIKGKITVSAPGNYFVATPLAGKKITIDSAGVTLYLDGAELSNEKKVIESNYGLTITLIGESTVMNSDTTDPKNAIDCAGDLVINGSGKLTVSSVKHGIKAKSISIVGATVNVASVKDGLCAEIEAYDSAIEQPIPKYADGGFVYIDGGKANINAGGDGIQADTFVYIKGENQSTIKAAGKGIKAGPIDWGASSTKLDWRGHLVLIKSGNIAIDSTDDAIHSDGDAVISGGKITYKTGGKSVHAGRNKTVADGTVVAG